MRMANGIEAAAGYWLPSEFLTDDDFTLTDKENFNKGLDADEIFPTHEDHLLQKFRAISTSPPSNLRSAGGSNNGSLRGAMDAKYDAVGQVAKRKLNSGYVMNDCPPPRIHAQFHKAVKNSTPSAHLNTTFENIGAREVVRGIGQVAWDPPHTIQRRVAAHGGGAAAAKKVCAGTGVFLPRRYDNSTDLWSKRRSPGCSASPFQGRASAQIHSNPLLHRFVESQPQPKIGRAFVSDHNSVLARRQDLVVMQQQRSFYTPMVEGSSMIGRDHYCLPQEWTY